MTIETDFSTRVIYPAILIDFELDSGERNFWTGTYSVEANGKTYLGLGGLDAGISIIETLELDDLSSDIRLSGVQDEFLAIAINEDFQNRPARIYSASLATDGTVSSTALEFTGTLEDMSIQEGPNDPSLDIIIRGAFADLESPRRITYSEADQAEIDPSDTFFTFLKSAQEAEPPFAS